MHNNGSMRPFATYIAWSVCLPVSVPACLLVTNVRPTNGNVQTQTENYCKRLYGKPLHIFLTSVLTKNFLQLENISSKAPAVEYDRTRS